MINVEVKIEAVVSVEIMGEGGGRVEVLEVLVEISVEGAVVVKASSREVFAVVLVEGTVSVADEGSIKVVGSVKGLDGEFGKCQVPGRRLGRGRGCGRIQSTGRN